MSLRDYVKVLRQRWLVILLCVLVPAAVVFVSTPATSGQDAQRGSYTATATLLVGQHAAADTSATPAAGRSALLGRIALFVTAGEVPKRAAARLGYTGDPVALAAGIKVVTDPQAQSLTISRTDADGVRAAEVANVFAREAVAYLDERPAGADNAALTILQEATPIPNSSFVIPPDRNSRTALAALLGLLFGFAVALVLDHLDARLRTRTEVAEALALPVIGEVPLVKRTQWRDDTILSVTEPLSAYADGYRAARTAILHSPDLGEASGAPSRAITSPPREMTPLALLVTSAHASEGKTTSAANLAASFAEAGQRVLVVDADLRSPEIHVHLDVPGGVGVSDYLCDPDRHRLAALIRPTTVPGVQVITAGTQLEHPAALASRMGTLLAEVHELADIVILDAAPVFVASEVFDVLPLVDGIVLVVRSGRLTNSTARRVSELLGRFRVPVLGAILIGAPERKADYYGYGYGYRRGDGYRYRKYHNRRKQIAGGDAANGPEAAAATQPSVTEGAVSAALATSEEAGPEVNSPLRDGS